MVDVIEWVKAMEFIRFECILREVRSSLRYDVPQQLKVTEVR